MDLHAMNDAQLAEYHHKLHKLIDEIEDSKQPAKDEIKAIEDILTQRLHDSGATAINTPHGTVHTVGKTTARIMDPSLFQEFIINGQHWAGIDWKANMSWCRSVMEKTKEAIPGVELSTYRRLGITAPKPTKRPDNV